jgi:hypothetical protein
MNLDNLNKWLTLAANVGVVAGLVFLVVEVQQNTNIARSSAYRESTQDMADWRALIASNPELTYIWDAYLRGRADSLDELESARLRQLLANAFGSYENAYYAYQLGIMGQSEWVRFENSACRNMGRIDRNNRFMPSTITDC